MSIKRIRVKTIANEFKNIIKNVIKVLKCDLDKEFSELKLLDSVNLKKRKYMYINIAKNSKEAGSIFKNFIGMTAIIITILGIIVPVYIKTTDNINNVFKDITDKKIELINQKEIKPEEKISQQEELSKKLSEAYINNIESVSSYFEGITKIVVWVIALNGVIILIMIFYNYKNSYYETVVQYIDDELIKNNDIIN
ncbi:hypothetical protein [Clostridium sp. UBA7791]|uniref:hypothetical protein n=1 Tax=Clostridium sp. UBA7791 TaxID=1946379 RepID=UPI0032164B36